MLRKQKSITSIKNSIFNMEGKNIKIPDWVEPLLTWSAFIVCIYLVYKHFHTEKKDSKPTDDDTAAPSASAPESAPQSAPATQSFAMAETSQRVNRVKAHPKIVHTPVNTAPFAPQLQEKKKYKDVLSLQQEMLRATRGVTGYADSIAPMPELRKLNYIKT